LKAGPEEMNRLQRRTTLAMDVIVFSNY